MHRVTLILACVCAIDARRLKYFQSPLQNYNVQTNLDFPTDLKANGSPYLSRAPNQYTVVRHKYVVDPDLMNLSLLDKKWIRPTRTYTSNHNGIGQKSYIVTPGTTVSSAVSPGPGASYVFRFGNKPSHVNAVSELRSLAPGFSKQPKESPVFLSKTVINPVSGIADNAVSQRRETDSMISTESDIDPFISMGPSVKPGYIPGPIADPIFRPDSTDQSVIPPDPDVDAVFPTSLGVKSVYSQESAVNPMFRLDQMPIIPPGPVVDSGFPPRFPVDPIFQRNPISKPRFPFGPTADSSYQSGSINYLSLKESSDDNSANSGYDSQTLSLPPNSISYMSFNSNPFGFPKSIYFPDQNNVKDDPSIVENLKVNLDSNIIQQQRGYPCSAPPFKKSLEVIEIAITLLTNRFNGFVYQDENDPVFKYMLIVNVVNSLSEDVRRNGWAPYNRYYRNLVQQYIDATMGDGRDTAIGALQQYLWRLRNNAHIDQVRQIMYQPAVERTCLTRPMSCDSSIWDVIRASSEDVKRDADVVLSYAHHAQIFLDHYADSFDSIVQQPLHVVVQQLLTSENLFRPLVASKAQVIVTPDEEQESNCNQFNIVSYRSQT